MSPRSAATRIDCESSRTIAIVGVVASGEMAVQGVASFSGGVLSQARGTPKRTAFGEGEVVGFRVVLG